MKTAYFGAATIVGLALAAPPVARDEWPIPLPWPGASPIPTPSDAPWQPGPNQACIYLTNDYGWQGYGVNLCMPNDQCGPKVPDGLNANISSANPNVNEVCYLYSEIECGGTASAPITNPGYDNLGTIGFDKLARSWKCWRTDNVCGLSTPSSGTSTSSTTSTSTQEPPAPFPDSTSSSTSSTTSSADVSTTSSESRITITASLPPSTTTISLSTSSWPTTATTGDPKLPSTDETTTSIYSTVTGAGTQMPPKVVTHTYVNGSTVVTTLFKRVEHAAAKPTLATTANQNLHLHYALHA